MMVCDICGKKLPEKQGMVRLQMDDMALVRMMADPPLNIKWDLCRPCAEKLHEGLLGTKKMMQALKGME